MTPRGLRQKDAAAYVALGLSKFADMVRDGRMPRPRKADRVSIWCMHELDEAFDALPVKEHIEQSLIDQRMDALDGVRQD